MTQSGTSRSAHRVDLACPARRARMSPPYADRVAIAELFRRAIVTPDETDAAALELERLTIRGTYDGFWQAQPDMSDNRAAAAL